MTLNPSYQSSFARLVDGIVEAFGLEALRSGRVHRDARGRLSFLLGRPPQDLSKERRERIEGTLCEALGVYARRDRVLGLPGEPGVDTLLAERPSQWLETAHGDLRVAALDRRIVGSDWLSPP